MASTTAAATTDAKQPTAPGGGGGGPQLKLLVDRRSRRVLYAEARKDAVDFLIGLLRVPLGLAARALATKHGEPVPGSLGSLYAGALALDAAFFASSVSVSPATNRDALLSPAALPSAALPLLLAGSAAVPPPPPPPPPQRYFRCNAYVGPCRGNPTNVTDAAEALWRRCGGEAAEIAEYTVDHAGRYVPKSERAADAAGLIDAIHGFVATAPDN